MVLGFFVKLYQDAVMSDCVLCRTCSKAKYSLFPQCRAEKGCRTYLYPLGLQLDCIWIGQLRRAQCSAFSKLLHPFTLGPHPPRGHLETSDAAVIAFCIRTRGTYRLLTQTCSFVSTGKLLTGIAWAQLPISYHNLLRYLCFVPSLTLLTDRSETC